MMYSASWVWQLHNHMTEPNKLGLPIMELAKCHLVCLVVEGRMVNTMVLILWRYLKHWRCRMLFAFEQEYFDGIYSVNNEMSLMTPIWKCLSNLESELIRVERPLALTWVRQRRYLSHLLSTCERMLWTKRSFPLRPPDQHAWLWWNMKGTHGTFKKQGTPAVIHLWISYFNLYCAGLFQADISTEVCSRWNS